MGSLLLWYVLLRSSLHILYGGSSLQKFLPCFFFASALMPLWVRIRYGEACGQAVSRQPAPLGHHTPRTQGAYPPPPYEREAVRCAGPRAAVCRRTSSTRAMRTGLGTAPTTVSRTCPSGKNTRAGMPPLPKRRAPPG